VRKQVIDVQIEIGAHYLADRWSQKLMTFAEFLDDFVENNTDADNDGDDDGDDKSVKDEDRIGYLAQTRLFDQIDALRRDILIPV
jgi:hypothetical protein